MREIRVVEVDTQKDVEKLSENNLEEYYKLLRSRFILGTRFDSNSIREGLKKDVNNNRHFLFALEKTD